MITQKRTNLCIRWTALFLLFSALVSLGQETQRSKKWFDDLDYLIKRVKITHPNIYCNVAEEVFLKAVDELREKIPSLTDLEITLEFYKLLALVRDGHTYVYMPQEFSNLLHYFPVRFYPFSDGLFIISADRNYKDFVGRRVIQFGHLSAQDAIKRISVMINGDNEMGRLKKIHRYLSLAEVLNYFGIIESTEELVLRLADRKGSKSDVLFKARPLSENYQNLLRGIFPVSDDSIITMNERSGEQLTLWLQRPDERYWFQYLENQNAVYVQINEMYDKEEEAFDPFCKRLFHLLDEHHSSRLIIDVRNNSGGNRIEWPLIREIISRPKLNQPDRIFLLIGRITFSAAQNLTNYIEKFTNATLVGEPTSGKPNHFGSVVHFTLPNYKLGVGCSVYYYQDSDPDDLRLATRPDISVPFTSEDYKNNNDPVLQRVLRDSSIESLPNLIELLKQAYEEKGVDGALKKYNEIRKDYIHAGIDVEYCLDRLASWLTWSKENIEDALQIYRSLIREYPDSVEGNFECGLSLERLKQYDEAKKYFRRCLELHPGHTGAKRRLGLIELESSSKKDMN